MYTNTRIGLALHHIGRFALENKKFFQFGDMYWLKKKRTAMGVPPEPPKATIFFDIHKEAMLAQLGVMLQLYRRFIHDVLGLWLFDPNPGKYHRKWTAFTLLMQDY